MKKPDIIAGILGIILSIYVIGMAVHFPEDKVLLLGPHVFPIVLSGGLSIACIVLIAMAVRGKSKPSTESFSLKNPGIQRSGITLVATIIYCALLNSAGFILASTLYLLFLMYLLKQRNYVKMITVALGITFAVYGIFRIILEITLPTGFLG